MRKTVCTNQEDFLDRCRQMGLSFPHTQDVRILSQPITLGSKTAPNRFACQAMEGCDGTYDGVPDELTKRRYDRFARGGAGVIWFEATAVMPEARANPRQLYIHDNNVDEFKRIVDNIREAAVKENGAAPLIVMQATHSGRYSKPEGKPAPLIAYNNPIYEKDSPLPKECIVTDDYLRRVEENLIHGAELAEKAGFDGVDIKCCHRYLNCELLSAFTREGAYGGSLENRTRLLRQSIRGAMERTGKDFLVSARLNVYDGIEYPYGFGVKPGSLEFDPTEPIWLLQQLQEMGVKLLNISMGNPYFNPHVNRPYMTGGYEAPEHPLTGVMRMLDGTAQLKAAVPEMKLICSALSYLGAAAPNVAAAYIKEGKFDMAGFGRTTFAYPDFAKDIMKNGAMDKSKLCICCSKCTEIMRKPGGTPGCVIRDKEVYGPIYEKFCGGACK